MRLLTLLFLLTTSLYGEGELASLEALIQVTEHNIELQKTLRTQLAEFIKLKEIFIKTPDDKELLFRVAKLAKQAVDLIKEDHLTSTFEPQFLSELNLFANLASKRGIPRAP